VQSSRWVGCMAHRFVSEGVSSHHSDLSAKVECQARFHLSTCSATRGSWAPLKESQGPLEVKKPLCWSSWLGKGLSSLGHAWCMGKVSGSFDLMRHIGAAWAAPHPPYSSVFTGTLFSPETTINLSRLAMENINHSAHEVSTSIL
jgi:hypothetical protein